MKLLLKPFIASLLLLLLAQITNAQCYGVGTYEGNLNITDAFQTEAVYSGERYTFTAVAGNTYIFSFCQGGGSYSYDTQLELCDASGSTVLLYNDDHCGTGSELIWNCTTGGTYSIVIYEYNCDEGDYYMGLLAYKIITAPSEQDCLGAIALCSDY
jgi:hypothetical protein